MGLEMSDGARELYDEAMALPAFGPGSERRHEILAAWGRWLERDRLDHDQAERTKLLATCGLVRGDRVQRKTARGLITSRNPVGVVVGLLVVQGRVKARVHWLSGQRRWGGGADFHTTVLASGLVKVAEDGTGEQV